MYIEIKETFNDVDYTNGCTGNIISKRAVLTTAHCIDDMLSIKEITIIYGTNDKTDRDNTVRASKWIHHNDIGVYYHTRKYQVFRLCWFNLPPN